MTLPVVNWDAGKRRRVRLEKELRCIVSEFPRLDIVKAILFGSLASGKGGPASDLDLILVVPSAEPFVRRSERFYEVLNPSVALDLFVCTPQEFSEMAESNPFVRLAVARGRVIYEG